jgi:acyl-homoserine-lactone acylase
MRTSPTDCLEFVTRDETARSLKINRDVNNELFVLAIRKASTMQRVFITAILIVLQSTCAFAQRQQTRDDLQSEILWDRWGVPHIYAKDAESAFRAFGWAQMHSHANLLLRDIAKARGRGAEYFGKDLLQSDQGERTWDFYGTARRWRGEQSPEMGRYLDAFAKGINDFAQQHPEALSTQARAVLPVDAVDILAHTTRVLYEFLSWDTNCSRALEDGFPAGSNGWAIAPSHSSSGHAMLLSNPHLLWGNELTFFEAQIVAPGYEMYGATLVGWPVMTIGFNQSLGWTGTVNMIRGCNVYQLTPEEDGYKLDGKKQTLTVEKKIIKVRQDDGSLKETDFEVSKSVFGPVVRKDGKLLALRAVGLQVSPYADALEEWLQMGRARDFAEFQSALKRLQIPMFTWIYADRAGHIFALFNGEAPRYPGADPSYLLKIMPGDSSSEIWNSIHSYADLPKIADPPAGWVQNSNCAPWYMTEPFLNPADYPADISINWSQHLGHLFEREQRAIRMLTQEPKISFDQLIADKYSTRSETADRYLDDLVAAAEQYGPDTAKRAARVLRDWNRTVDVDSRGAVLFQFWINQMHGDFSAEPFDPKRPLDTPRGFQDAKAAAEALAAAATKLQALTGRLDVPWGELYRFRRGQWDLPGNGSDNRFGTFRVIDYLPTKDGHFEAFDGDTFIAAVEFGDPIRARVLLTYGNSSDPASVHYGDQLVFASKKELRDAWITRGAVEQNQEEHTIFSKDGKITTSRP